MGSVSETHEYLERLLNLVNPDAIDGVFSMGPDLLRLTDVPTRVKINEIKKG